MSGLPGETLASDDPRSSAMAPLELPLGHRDAGAERADSSTTAQPRLWLTTSTLCPSGSSTNAP